MSGPKSTNLHACAEFTLLCPSHMRSFSGFQKSLYFAKGLQPPPASFGLSSQDSVSYRPQRRLRSRARSVGRGTSFCRIYKRCVDSFMCNGSSYTIKGFPSTIGLFRADNEAKLKEQKSSAFKMIEVHFLNFCAL